MGTSHHARKKSSNRSSPDALSPTGTPTFEAPVPIETQEPSHGARRWWLRVGRIAAIVIFLLVVCGVAIVATAVLTGDWQATPIVSGSMVPKLPIGSIAVSQREPLNDLRVGDIAELHPPFSRQVTYVHEIIRLHHRDGKVIVKTKGIANPIPDPWTVVVTSSHVYLVRGEIPYVGYVVSWVRTRGGHETVLVGAGLFAMLLVTLTLRDVIIDRRRDHEAASVTPDDVAAPPTT